MSADTPQRLVWGAQRCCWLVLASPQTVTQALIGVWRLIHYLSWKPTDSQGKGSVPFLETGHAGAGATGDGGAAKREPGASTPGAGVRAAHVHSSSQLMKHVAHCGTSQLPFTQGQTEAQSWRGAWLAQSLINRPTLWLTCSLSVPQEGLSTAGRFLALVFTVALYILRLSG